MKKFRSPLLVLVLFFVSTVFAGPVSHFGRLTASACTSGNICGDITGSSTPVFVKGPSLFWSDGEGAPYYIPEVVDWLVDEMNIGVIRAAMAIRYREKPDEVNNAGGTKGYYFDKPAQMSLMKSIIDAAIENDIYVIVDWHSHYASEETSLATTFFVDSIAKNPKYKDKPNIIWEVWNEPLQNESTTAVTNHANTIITALRAAGNQNLVLIGSPRWSSKPNDQRTDWGSSRDKNVAFTFHFYAYSHQQGGEYGTQVSSTKSGGAAVFGSEWGITSADGGGNISESEATKWTDWMDQQKISNCMWSASAAKAKYTDTSPQASSMFTLQAVASSLSTTQLTTSGKYFQTYMGKNKWTSLIPSAHPKGNDLNTSAEEGKSLVLSTQLGLKGKVTKVSFAPSSKQVGEFSFTDNSITYTPPASGSDAAKVKLIYEVTDGSVVTQSRITINLGRKPLTPQKNPIAVSRKLPTDIKLTDLSISDPNNQTVEFTSVSIDPTSVGALAISSAKTTVTFTPSASMANASPTNATFEYTVTNKSGLSSTASVVLRVQNFAPTIRANGGTYAPSYPNNAPVGIGMKLFAGDDKDGDAIYFDKFYLDPQYPGTLVQVKPDSLVYTPDPNKTGKVTFLAVISDGTASSPIGGLNITLTGNGTPIGDLPLPTQIPDYVPPEPPEEPDPVIASQQGGKGLYIASPGLGIVELYFERSGVAKLDVYSISGKKVGSLLNGYQNAGSKEVSLRSLNLQKGIYILRLSQGSQVKTMRVVN